MLLLALLRDITPLTFMLCVPIKAPTVQKVFQEMEKIGKKANLMEIWLDQITELNLPKIIKKAHLPLICANKPTREKGKFKGAEEDRIKILQQAIDLGTSYVDIGIDTPPKLLKQLIRNKKKTKIIISYHNFQKTPSIKRMLEIAKKAYRLGADIAKISVYAQKIEDNLKIFELTQRICSKKKKIISICMGPEGKISRIVCPMLGSYLMYVPIEDSKKSAEGQITLNNLKRIKTILRA